MGRPLDILLAVVLVVLLSPLLVISALVVLVDDGLPILFRQQRVGRNGVPFTIYKLRTMRNQTPEEAKDIFVTERDPRITRTGRFLRASSLDELPQLFNVLAGDMGFVGPRPPLLHWPRPYEEYDEFQRRRFSVRPGITGWAQVNGRNLVGWDDRIKLDVEYVERRSLAFDLKIMCLTALRLVRRGEHYRTEKPAGD